MTGTYVLTGSASYLMGAIPFGYILVRILHKKDIRDFGSGNPGATNVWRSFGKKLGLTTLALDILKGWVPVYVTRSLFPNNEVIALVAAVLAICGHNWSIFLMGKGGKGVATSAGAFLALLPLQFGIALGVFILVFAVFRIVSLGSIFAAVALATATLLTDTTLFMRGAVGLISAVVILKHHSNIKRLIKGTEPKTL